MEKKLPKIRKHVAELGVSIPPPEFVAQQEKIDGIVKGTSNSNLGIESDGMGSMPVRAMERVKLICKATNLIFELPVYYIDMQADQIHLEVMPEFSMRLAVVGRLDFTLMMSDQTSYPVAFFGQTVNSPNYHGISFARILDAAP